MTGIVDVIIEALIEELEDACQTGISTSDPTYVDTIKHSRLTEEPESEHGNHIMIYDNDPRNPSQWRDEGARMGATFPMRGDILRGEPGWDFAEIGGGEHYWRRFTAHVLCQYTHLGYTQDEAMEYATSLFQRVRQRLRSCKLVGADDFGATITDILPKCRWEERYATGDEEEWAWHMFLGLEVLTIET